MTDNIENKSNNNLLIASFLSAYKQNKLKLVFSFLLIAVGFLMAAFLIDSVFGITLITKPWFLILFSMMIVFTIMKPGAYYILERKKEITNGFFTLIEDYLVVAENETFSSFVEEIMKTENKIKRYPLLFVNEFLIDLSIQLKSDYSTTALKEILHRPQNQYYEINKYQDFVINTIESNDKSLRQALKTAITTSEEGKRKYYEKAASSGFIAYLAIGFMLIFPTIFISIFLSSFASSGLLPGISAMALQPSQFGLTLWFTITILSGASLIAIFKYYTGKEGTAIKQSYYAFVILFIVCIAIYVAFTII